MSVINQMLRDLDARGQGDAGARRRAAMVSVGDAGGKAPSAWRSSRLWWLVAALTVALAVAVVLLVASRWRAIDALADPEDLAPAPVAPATLGEAPAEPVTRLGPPETAVREASAEPARIEAKAERVAPPSPPPAEALPRAEALPPARTLPPAPSPSPPARASIERAAPVIDPLEPARTALADGRPDAALLALADTPGDSAEHDALEAAALQQLGRHDDAEQAYRRALRREPDIGAWWAGLGISLDASGRGDEALGAFREAQRRGPLDPALADYLGERVEALSAVEPSR